MNNTKSIDNPIKTNDDGFSPQSTITPEVYCFNTLHLTNAFLGFCEDDLVLCSSDLQVAASCCKCKPGCCGQCTSRNSAWDSAYPIVCSAERATDVTTTLALIYAVSVILCGICIFMKRFRQQQQQYQRQTRIQPHNPELPKEELQARAEQIPSKFHIRTIQTMDCIRSLIEHKESSKTASNAGKKEDVMEDVMEDVSLDDDANTNASSNTASSDIDVEQGRHPSPILLLSFWRKQDVENAECPICLEIYRLGDTICISKVAECDHVFHQACVSEWLSKHDQCPLCRIDLMSETC
jgi:hypothetical protein